MPRRLRSRTRRYITKPRPSPKVTFLRPVRRTTRTYSRMRGALPTMHLQKRRYAPRPWRVGKPLPRPYIPVKVKKRPNIQRLKHFQTARVLKTGRKKLTLCDSKARRRAVLLSIGRVQRAGGAPGPYKPRDNVRC